MMNIQSKTIGDIVFQAPVRKPHAGCVDQTLVDKVILSGQGQDFQTCLNAPNVKEALREIFQATALNKAAVQEIAHEHLGESWKGNFWTVDGKSMVVMSSNLQEIQLGLQGGNIDLMTSSAQGGAQMILGEVNTLGEFVAGSIVSSGVRH